MGQDVEVGVIHGLDNSLGLFFARSISISYASRFPRSLPVGWAKMLKLGLSMAWIILLVCFFDDKLNLECTAQTTRSNFFSIESARSNEPSSRISTSMPLSSLKPENSSLR